MKKLWHIYTYILYLFKSRSRYTTHSPFVYEFIESTLKDKTGRDGFEKLNNYKQKTFNSRSQVETVDFGSGAGNKPYRTFTMEIGKIAKRRTHSKKQLEDLYKISNYFKPSVTLEIGTAVGISSLYLKKGNKDGRLITMEGCAGLAYVAQKGFAINKFDDIEIVTGNFNNTLPELLTKLDTLDMVFFDGNHKKEPTLDYFNQCLKLANENSVFLIDDIYWSKGMTSAWNEIKNHPSVSFTIDIYWMGMVFFKKGITKQNFVIRY